MRSDDKSRMRFVLLTLLLVLAWNFTTSLVGLGWSTATIISFGVFAIYLLYAWRQHDQFFVRIVVFSLVAGFTELLADRWLVDVTATLVYYRGGPFIWRSPLYMPFAWAVVLTQLSYLSWWLSRRIGMVAASLVMALIGAVNIPLYEQWAKGAMWWFYRNSHMIGNTPWYVIAGEFLIVLALPAAMSLVERSSWRMTVITGMMQGLWIWAGYAIAFTVFSQP